MKPVSELLKKRAGTLWHVHPDDTVYAALELLAKHEVGALLVMDQGRLVGVVSERDYTRKIALSGLSSKDTRVSQIMTPNPVTVSSKSDTHKCMAAMSEGRFRHLPVVDGETVIGMISIRDIMDDIIADHEQTIAQLENYIHS
jgi:CBS domain-containing protein